MTNLSILRRKLENVINTNAAGDRDYLGGRQKQRAGFIEQSYKCGGKLFVKLVKRYGTTEKGDRLKYANWFLEFLEVIGDFRLSHVLTTGNAQTGKTLGHNLLNIACVAVGKLNTAWFYDSRTNLDQNVPMQFHPVAEFWIANMLSAGHRLRRGRDRSINTRYQVDQCNCIFSYVSTSKPTLRSATGQAAAGGAVVSFQADAMFLEERSQYPPGAADPLPRRLDASMLPTKPIRELGTPGSGQGIEAELKDVHRYFYPHFQCPNCQNIIPLDPKGCLLIETTTRDLLGRSRRSFFSESGRPLEWHYSDEGDRIGSAYFACPECKQAISDEDRFNAHFRCRETGESARDFLDSLPSGIPDRPWKIAVHLSPLVRQTEFNLAAQLITAGISAKTTADWQQQALGHPSEASAASVSLDMLLHAMKAPKPDRVPDFTLAGIDVGRSEDWFFAVDFYLPEGYEQMEPATISERTIRVVKFGEDIMRDLIPSLLQENGVEYGLIDNEPSRESSMNICRETCLEMGDQVSYLKRIVDKTVVADGGIEEACWLLRNEKFMNQVLEGFLLEAPDGYSLYRLPTEWEQWVSSPTERSPLVHLAGPWRDADGQWHRGRGNVDDGFMALLFCEAAFYIKLNHEMGNDFVPGFSSKPLDSFGWESTSRWETPNPTRERSPERELK